ncbi:hypothetical protein [Paenibacillus andongensis]|uniref:hypothetical protein n=1 Tax=Paenibacillus andongensis TaxID=2975482 RepID=UPI0021BB2DE4|nr:hypothetical protein [Paenibacillus andongensis]
MKRGKACYYLLGIFIPSILKVEKTAKGCTIAGIYESELFKEKKPAQLQAYHNHSPPSR